MALKANRFDIIWVVLLVVGLVCFSVGSFLVDRAFNRDVVGNFPQTPDMNKLHEDELPGQVLEDIGFVSYFGSIIFFVYSLINHWRIATRRKPVEGTAISEVWFCPYCGKLDIQGAKRCPGCGKSLPKFIAIKNGVWVPADSEAPHKVTIGRDGKAV